MAATVCKLLCTFNRKAKLITKDEIVLESGAIKIDNIERVDQPPMNESVYDNPYIVNATRIQTHSGDVVWTIGCRKWWDRKIQTLNRSAAALESEAKMLRREAVLLSNAGGA